MIMVLKKLVTIIMSFIKVRNHIYILNWEIRLWRMRKFRDVYESVVNQCS